MFKTEQFKASKTKIWRRLQPFGCGIHLVTGKAMKNPYRNILIILGILVAIAVALTLTAGGQPTREGADMRKPKIQWPSPAKATMKVIQALRYAK